MKNKSHDQEFEIELILTFVQQAESQFEQECLLALASPQVVWTLSTVSSLCTMPRISFHSQILPVAKKTNL